MQIFDSPSLGAPIFSNESEDLRLRIRHYLDEHRIRPPGAVGEGTTGDTSVVAANVFDLLTSRRFCYLSRSRMERYRDGAVAVFKSYIERGEPIRFFYDLGGGYRAALNVDDGDLGFTVGLGEWLVLGQISSFARRILEHYAPGAVFSIVIDNLCALAVNDIPTSSTESYVSKLRELIDKVGMQAHIDLLVESEQFVHAKFLEAVEVKLVDEPEPDLATEQLHNIHRFLGRRCSLEEARQRARKYGPATRTSDEFLNEAIRGLRMTQRATPGTLCFRPFPGGDSRIQAGQVAMTENSKGALHPILLTSSIVDGYELVAEKFPSEFSEILDPIIFARRI